MAGEREIVGFAVQRFNPPTGNWRNINDRILTRDHTRIGVEYKVAVERARAAADREVTGWSAAYPQEEYRAVPFYFGGTY